MLQLPLVVFIIFCMTAPTVVFAQHALPPRSKKVYNVMPFIGQFTITFCDSVLSGAFVDSWNPGSSNGSLTGRFTNDEWHGQWSNTNTKGGLIVVFSDDYDSFKGMFYRDDDPPDKWRKCSGSAVPDWLTANGKRSPWVAAFSSFVLPGAGQRYNRESEKALWFQIPYFIGAIGVIVSMISFFEMLFTFTPSSFLSPETTKYMLLGGIGLMGTTMIVSAVDAFISANEINTRLIVPLPQCNIWQLHNDNGTIGLGLSLRHAVITPFELKSSFINPRLNVTIQLNQPEITNDITR